MYSQGLEPLLNTPLAWGLDHTGVVSLCFTWGSALWWQILGWDLFFFHQRPRSKGQISMLSPSTGQGCFLFPYTQRIALVPAFYRSFLSNTLLERFCLLSPPSLWWADQKLKVTGVDASGQLPASELAHLPEYLSEFQLSVHFWPQKIWFFTYLSTQQHLEIFLKNILFSIFRGRVIRILQDYCLPFSFVYSVHFYLLASSVNPPGRECGSVLAMSCLHMAVLFLLETAVKFLGLTGVWEFHSLSLEKETLLLSQAQPHLL